MVVDLAEKLVQAIQASMVEEMAQRQCLCGFAIQGMIFFCFSFLFLFLCFYLLVYLCVCLGFAKIWFVCAYLCQWRWFRCVCDSFHIRISANALCHAWRFDLAQIDSTWCVCERLFIFCHHRILDARRHFMLWLRLYSSCWYRSIHHWWRRWSRTNPKTKKRKSHINNAIISCFAWAPFIFVQ